MREADVDVNDAERIACSEKSAELLFDAGDASAGAIYEPRDSLEANAAVQRLGQLFKELPGTITRVLEAASGSATLISSDRLQGIAEIVQNADDSKASQVRLLLTPSELLVAHDGRPVRLQHVLGFATPWLSTKSEDPAAFGRFGIGLMTLRSLSATMEVHCPPYHVKIGEPSLSPVARPALPLAFQESGWTTLRIPLEEGSICPEELVEWLDRWDDSALLFLRHVSRVTLLSLAGETVRELTLMRYDHTETEVDEPSVAGTLSRHYAKAKDGRSWVVYSMQIQSPPGLSRSRKATESTTPVSVALPLSPVQAGKVYAGLPVASAASPLFASAQFDPLTNRLGFADNEWNRALVPLVAKIWSHAALDLFRHNHDVAWLAMPLPVTESRGSGWSLVESLEDAVTRRARHWLPSRLSFQVPDQGVVSLSQLAVEARPLEHILTETETATLADLPATLPSQVRDEAGRWRDVLQDWRIAGADLPEPVSVERALELIGDESRPADSTIALAAVALDENLGKKLMALPCVVTDDGRHLVPPSGDSPNAVTAEATLLARQLGLVTVLHSAHVSGDLVAAKVLFWLEEIGALLDSSDDRSAVYRLAAAGRSGRVLETPLTDEQVKALRDAFELLDPAGRAEVAADVGRAVLLDAYYYDGKQRRIIYARPVEAYLPRKIDRDLDSFANAAEQASGPIWVDDKYVEALRSPVGRRGIGAQRFLRLLGAETAPRVHPHPQLHQRFSDTRRGLHTSVSRSPEARKSEMQRRGATYTLQDCYSPDLEAVAEDIAKERRKGRRQRRSAALLTTLGRAWDRYLVDFAEVESAYDYFQWQMKGQIRAFWLWQVGNIAWLDDESGTPRRPIELRIRTPGNVAIYGNESSDYLHRELYQPNRQAVLTAIGVLGDPSRSELVDQLIRLRDGLGEGQATLSTSSVHREAAIIYKALSHDLDVTSSRSDLSATQIRTAFQQGTGLLLTNLGWLPPRSVLAGPRIFRDYMAFTPQVEGAEPLWNALSLRKPSPEDCLRVIHRIARKRAAPDSDDETVLLETLRALTGHYRNENFVRPRRLSRLALRTSKGWLRDRPVYATDDSALASGLRNKLPLWEPGGEIEQFQPLLAPLRVELIRTADVEVIDADLANLDQEATHLFQNALSLLKEDLARNDPQLAAAIQVPWDTLGEYNVRVHPSLSLRVRAGLSGSEKEYTCDVDARVDATHATMFVRHPSLLLRVDGGGEALAALFEANTRRLAHAWRAVCDQAEGGVEARGIELADQRDGRDRAHLELEISRRTSSFRDTTVSNAGVAGRSEGAGPSTGRVRQGRSQGPKAIDMGPPRILVDPGSLKIVDPKGRIEKGATDTHRPRSRGKLVDPVRVSTPPRNRIPIRGYSDKEREDVGMDLVRMLLSSDSQEIVDLRSQRNVGADAIDSMDRFYELKVIAGDEPDRVTLTNSEFQRAKSDDNFFLVVVSGIEGIDARPKVRVFVDPLNQLQETYTGSITLSGVRNVESLVYEFATVDREAVSSGDEEP